MKRNINLKTLVALMMASSTLLLGSCVKNRNDGAVDFSQLAPIVQIVEGGMKNFGASTLPVDLSLTSDTGYFRVNYAATTPAPTDITVTLAYDAAALAAYNAANPSSINQKFPDSIYNFVGPTTVVIKAGQSYSDPVKIAYYPQKIDPSKNYMFPISITNASGVNISGNFGTIYYHFIGNCLAGNYNVVGTRYNYNGVIGWTGGPIPPATAGTAAVPSPKTLVPDNSTTTHSDYANLGVGTDRDIYYVYDCSAGGTNIDNYFTPSFAAGISNVLFVTHSYNPATKVITELSTYNNLPGGAGSDRIVSEVLTHQ